MRKATYVLLLTALLIFSTSFASAATVKPTKLNDINATDTSISISWNKTSGAAGYTIMRKVPSGSWKCIAEVSSTKTTYTDKSVTSGKAYLYTVKAYKKSGNKKVYGGYDSKGLSAVAISAPKIISKVKTIDSITLKWTKKSNASGYDILKYNEDKAVYEVIKSVKTTTYQDTGLNDCTRYKYRIIPYKTFKGIKYYGSICSVGTSTKTMTASQAFTISTTRMGDNLFAEITNKSSHIYPAVDFRYNLYNDGKIAYKQSWGPDFYHFPGHTTKYAMFDLSPAIRAGVEFDEIVIVPVLFGTINYKADLTDYIEVIVNDDITNYTLEFYNNSEEVIDCLGAYALKYKGDELVSVEQIRDRMNVYQTVKATIPKDDSFDSLKVVISYAYILY